MPERDAPTTWTAIGRRLPSANAMLGVVLVLAFAGRARMLAIPLGRDEGVYATIGWSILEGIPLYTGPVDLQMPGLWILYAGVMALFGTTSSGVHAGLLAANLVSIGLVFLLGRRLFDPAGGAIAAAAFAALSLSHRMLGFTANAEHFILPFALGGAVLLLRALDSGRRREFFLAGLVAGLALMVKQQGVFFTSFVGAYALYGSLRSGAGSRRSNLAKLALVAAGAVTPLACCCLWFAANGVFGEFFFWAFRYSATYGAGTSLEDSLGFLRQNAWPILPHTAVYCGLAAVGLFAGVREPGAAKRDPARTMFLVGFTLFSALAVLPGLYFRHHYFLLVAPAVALLNVAATEAILRRLGWSGRSHAALAAAGLSLLALAQWAIPQRAYLFSAGPNAIARETYQNTPVVELMAVAEKIRSNSEPDDALVVLGSEPQLYLYSRRRPATSLIVMYPMMWAPPEMALELQRRTIREIEAAKPKFAVLVVNSSSWSRQDRSERLLIDWLNDWGSNYRKVGAVEMNHPRPSRYVWGAEAETFVPGTRSYLLLLERLPRGASESTTRSGPE